MKTEELIAALTADQTRPGPAPARAIGLAAVTGAALSLSILLGVLGTRADLMAALSSWRFDVKLALVVLAAAVSLADALRLASPVASAPVSRASLLVPTLLAAAVASELLLVPPEAWAERLLGTNARVCLTVIPALSLAPLALGLLAMRHGAPSSPVAAGAAVGRFSAAVAAVLYALHCFDDSPLFVAVWYPLAALPVVALGALAGRRLLRW